MQNGRAGNPRRCAWKLNEFFKLLSVRLLNDPVIVEIQEKSGVQRFISILSPTNYKIEYNNSLGCHLFHVHAALRRKMQCSAMQWHVMKHETRRQC